MWKTDKAGMIKFLLQLTGVQKMLNKLSWRTTALGIAAILSAVAGAASLLLDADPATNPDWTSVLTAIAAGVGLIMARDNNKTSANVGADAKSAVREAVSEAKK